MVNYLNQPRVLKQRNLGGGKQPGSLSSCVLALCLLVLTGFEVDTFLKWMPLKSKLKLT